MGKPEATDASADVDAWLGRLPEEQRAALQRLREVIRRAAPEAVEAISYSIPAFKYRGRPLVSYAAAKDHLSFFVMSTETLAPFVDDLAGFDTSGGTLRFQPGAPPPDGLVERLVRARMAETDADASAKRPQPR